jgi:hypothetical protein
MSAAAFHGSYAEDDVTFLLHPLAPGERPPCVDDVHEKERLIQSGERHYGDMISLELPPEAAYLALFHDAVDAHAGRMARDLVHLARRIRAARAGAVTLVSLARAGTPVGVLLRRLLQRLYGIDAPHYSVSVIRDRGLDCHALDHILARHDAPSVVFVDGWTAKGGILGELRRSLAAYAQQRGVHLPAELFVLSDLAGQAHASGSTQDYLIPSALLNASVSGLVSRSILNDPAAPPRFHGCLHYADWQAHDVSRWFIERILSELGARQAEWLAEPLPVIDAAAAADRSRTLVHALAQRHAVADTKLLKPGIGEATRALLRRAPRLLILRDPGAAEVRHLVQLARERGVPIEVEASLPLHAVAIIGSLSDG